MFLEKSLLDFGLSEKEAKIYLAALELGTDSVQNIAQKAGIKRPTAYVIIEDLIRRGLLSEKPTERGSTYIAEDPDKLARVVQERQHSVKQALPFLRAMYNVEKGKPQVRVYEGIEGMKQVYLETVWKSKTEILFFSSIRKIYEALPDLLDLWIADATGETNYQRQAKEFVNPDPVDIAYGQKILAVNPRHEVRVVPPEFPQQFVGTDNAIFEDKIMMVSFAGKLFTTLIQSQVLADTLRTLFSLAWQSAEPLDVFVRKHPEMKKETR